MRRGKASRATRPESTAGVGFAGARKPTQPEPGTAGSRRADLDTLRRAINVEVADDSLLLRALVHRSALNELPDLRDLGSNERLEFLGDSVLAFIIADHLYRALPDAPEGTLTEMRAAIVREVALAEVATRLDLGRQLILGRGEDESGGRSRSRLLASAFEAVLGAIYLDQGLEAARSFALQMLSRRIEDALSGSPLKDAKSRLQEAAQAVTGVTPAYDLVSAAGPDHAPRFEVAVTLADRVLATGVGGSKQEAEEAAAREALARLDSLDLPRR